jgi:LAO/AO transport system kinase
MDRRELARALSSANSITVPRRSFEPWRVLGVTGSPGVGKSCLVERIVSHWLECGERVAILAVDPSSPITGGALLGDRMRMTSVDAGDDVFFRSIATRNVPGGLPSRLDRMVDLLVHEGWTRVIIETVGSGQSEIRIVAVADRLLLVEGPGRGDVIQAEKAGVMELADLIVVNKSDLPGADKVAEEIRLSLNFSESDNPEVVLCSAETGEGISDMVTAIDTLPAARGPSIARARERLLSTHQENLISHPEFSDVLKGLSEGRLSIEEALSTLQRG